MCAQSYLFFRRGLLAISDRRPGHPPNGESKEKPCLSWLAAVTAAINNTQADVFCLSRSYSTQTLCAVWTFSQSNGWGGYHHEER
jgi:hypothetical protein